MNREFQALFQDGEFRFEVETGGTSARGVLGKVLIGFGPMLTVTRIAEGADQVRAELEAAGKVVHGITEIRAVVDWSKPAYTRDEVGVLLGITGDTVSKNKGTGQFPFAAIGNGVYPAKLVHAFIAKNLNPAGKKLAQELEAA